MRILQNTFFLIQNKYFNVGADNILVNNSIQCPNCSNPLQESKKHEIDIDYCPTCKGVWLDRGEIDKIANMQNRYEEEHYQKYNHDQRDYDDDGYYDRRRGGFFGDLFNFD